MDDLVSLYTDREESVIVLIGGPADGQRFTVKGDRPPMAWLVPVPEPLSVLMDAASSRPSFLKAMYQPILDETGFWSRTDDGAWRFACKEQSR